MRRALILCSDLCEKFDLKTYDHVICLNLFAYLKAKEAHPSCHYFYQQPFRLPDHAYFLQLDKNLHEEHRLNKKLKWAPLAFRTIFYSHLYYKYSKIRLESLLPLREADLEVELSSSDNTHFIIALKVLAAQYGFRSKISATDSFDYSSLDPFLAANDLKPYTPSAAPTKSPPPTPNFLIRLFSFLLKIPKKKIFFQTHWSLKVAGKEGSEIKYYYFFLFDKIRAKLFKKDIFSLSFSRRMPREDIPFLLTPAVWQGFPQDEMTVINSTLHLFFSESPQHFIDKIHRNLCSFYKNIRQDAVFILNDPYNPLSRLIQYFAKKQGVKSFYLPHGIVIESMFSSTLLDFFSSEITAWNPQSALAFQNNGCNATVISYPLIQRFSEGKIRPYPNAASIKVLVCVRTGDPINITAFENSIYECHQALNGLSTCEVYYKYHDSYPALQIQKKKFAADLQAFCQNQLRFLPSDQRILDIVTKYDLAIVCGQSTAAIECILSNVPTILYKNARNNGLLNDMDLVYADTGEELSKTVQHFPLAKAQKGRDQLYQSLIAGISLKSLK